MSRRSAGTLSPSDPLHMELSLGASSEDLRAAETAAETQAALDSLVERRKGPKPLKGAVHVEYQPRDGGPVRTLKIVDCDSNPFEVGRHKRVDAPEARLEVAFPVTRKVEPASVEELQQWRVPRLVSAWKNPGNRKIDLATRLANDPRLKRPIPEARGGKALAEMLEAAEAEVHEQREASLLEEARGGREAFLEREAKRARSARREGRAQDEDDDPHDSRLYTKARPATTAAYDGPLYATQAVREMVPQVEFEGGESEK